MRGWGRSTGLSRRFQGRKIEGDRCTCAKRGVQGGAQAPVPVPSRVQPPDGFDSKDGSKAWTSGIRREKLSPQSIEEHASSTPQGRPVSSGARKKGARQQVKGTRSGAKNRRTRGILRSRAQGAFARGRCSLRSLQAGSCALCAGRQAAPQARSRAGRRGAPHGNAGVGPGRSGPF